MAAQLPIRLDPSLSRTERTLVVADLYQLLQYQIISPSSHFIETFGDTPAGSNTNAGVIRYLNDRITTVINQDVNLGDRLAVETGDDATSAAKAYIVALNISPTLWFASLEMAAPLFFASGNGYIPITSSRVGIMQLGEGYTAETDGDYIFPPLVRISTFVHEARHSDCTGGLKKDALPTMLTDIPSQHSCGHLHIQCPGGVKNYEGLYACDGEAWGAYSVQAVYAANLAYHCVNCTNSEKSIAKAIAADSLSRVLPGQVGFPDMSSDSSLKD